MKILPVLGICSLSALVLAGCATSGDQESFIQAKRNFQQRNYQQAYEQILVPAEKGNPEAEYALGYMYYYGKGTGINHVLGKYWIRKAATDGNENAIKAYQMILAQEQGIMQEPAQQQLSIQKELSRPEHDLTSNVHHTSTPLPKPHSGKMATATPHPAAKTTAHYTKHEQAILKQTPNHYTIQLMDASSVGKAESFIRHNHLQANGKFYKRQLNGKTLYVVIYGNYPDDTQAHAAIKKLPADIQKLQPWMRSYQNVQAEITTSH